VRRLAQAPTHYKVELRRPASGDGRTDRMWRAVERIHTGSIVPLRFASLEAAQAHAARLSR
jgi:hypothetical protein